MKTIEQVAKMINKEIERWTREGKKLIIAIDGYTGSGKTSVADRLAKLNSSYLVIHLDDLIKHWKIQKQMMDIARDRSKVFEYKWYRYDALEQLVKAFLGGKRKYIRLKLYDFDRNEFTTPQTFNLSKNILVIEGIFLFHPRHKRNTLWGKRIFLKANLKKAERRRIKQERKKWGKDYLPENHPNSYIRDFKIAYKRYLDSYKPEQKANLVIDVDSDKKSAMRGYKCDQQ